MQKSYLVDRGLHWLSALLLILMLLNLSAELHTVDWDIKGQLLHRQEAVEKHAMMGIALFVILLGRIAWTFAFKSTLPRIIPKSTRHQWLIKITHASLYLTLALLVITGILMLNNYDLSTHVYAFELQGDKQKHIERFPAIHQIHMLARDGIWWMIAIHFFGILAARR